MNSTTLIAFKQLGEFEFLETYTVSDLTVYIGTNSSTDSLGTISQYTIVVFINGVQGFGRVTTMRRECVDAAITLLRCGDDVPNARKLFVLASWVMPEDPAFRWIP